MTQDPQVVGDESPLLTMEFTGGFRAPNPANFTPTPFLRIFDDGRVITGLNTPGQQSHSCQLRPAELKRLLDDIEAIRFAAMSSQTIEAEIKATNKRILIADAPTTEISLRTEKGEHRIAVYALSYVASQMPEVEALPKLKELEIKLRRVHGLALMGGPDELDKWVGEANQYLRANHPLLSEFRPEHLVSASIPKPGSLKISFMNPTGSDDETPRPVRLNLSFDGASANFQIAIDK